MRPRRERRGCRRGRQRSTACARCLLYLQPGVVVVWPGGWHLPTCGPELPAPPPWLPGPNAGAAIDAGTIADVAINARAVRPRAPLLRALSIRLLLAHSVSGWCASANLPR